MKKYQIVLILALCVHFCYSQEFKQLEFKKQTFELHNVTGEVIKFEGKKVLKIERDLETFPFDEKNLEATVDDRHYARLIDLNDFENGTIEVKMYSQLQNPAPYPGIAGFIGVYLELLKTILNGNPFICVPKWEELITNLPEIMLSNIFHTLTINFKPYETVFRRVRMKVQHLCL